MKILSLFVSLVFCSSSWVVIPKASLILQRLSENSGAGYYQIEQEVQFPNGLDNLILKETWLIENENSMKLIVTGAKDLKDLVSFSMTFSGGVRTQGALQKKLTDDFIEKYFHIRNPETLAQTFVQLKIAPVHFLSKKVIRSLKDVDNQPENFVRLARAGGVLTYAFGSPGDPEQPSQNPGFWIEQDQFLLRKFRLPDQIEVTADRYSNFSRGLSFPRTRIVRWGQNQVTIQTVSVQARSKEAWKNFGLRTPTKLDGLNGPAGSALIEEFYKRFR